MNNMKKVFSVLTFGLPQTRLGRVQASLTLLSLLLRFSVFSVFSVFCVAQSAYAQDGSEWQNPQTLSLGKLEPAADVSRLEEYRQSLDGVWKFHWVETPDKRPRDFYKPAYDVSAWDDIEVPGCWNVQGLQKDGSMKWGVPIYVNQPVIFYHQVQVDDWKKGVMREAPKDWTVHQYPNEVGSYRRSFTVPQNWNGRQVLINFDGVDSFFYLWINGQYVGFSKNSRNTASFDITDLLTEGENTVAVEVYRTSDGSFLESQDMFRLPGIIRDTYLTAVPGQRIGDIFVYTRSINEDGSADVVVETQSQGFKSSRVQGFKSSRFTFQVQPVKLYSDEVMSPSAPCTLNSATCEQSSLHLPAARLWSAEEPNRYLLTAELKDAKGNTLDRVQTYFGICKVEIRDTRAEDDEFGLAGRYLFVNNKPVKLKGVNRHETNPSTGHTISREQMEHEVMLMKQGNINHVRLSHYCNYPYFYDLADKYGLYLMDEANIESHEYYYGDASLSHPKEWEAAHVQRVKEMVAAHKNHPSVLIWSLGNEAGPGQNFVAAYNEAKRLDPTRPVQYERNNNIVDMGSNQYPSVDWVRGAVKGNYKIKYPFHINEYAHSMGNAVGNLIDYWQAIESTNFFCGGAIWDWVDQAIDTYTEDGVKYMGYGGDHGDNPNNGMFCMNGIMLPDLSPKPQYWEVKKVYQNVGVETELPSPSGEGQGVRLRIFNKNYFTSLSDYNIRCKLIEDGREIHTFDLGNINIPPRSKAYAAVDLSSRFLSPLKDDSVPEFTEGRLSSDHEYFLNVEFVLNTDKPWAKTGYVQMAEQLAIGQPENTGISGISGISGKSGISVNKSDGVITIIGDNFTAEFSTAEGAISSLIYNGKTMIANDGGPRINAFRAQVDNDNWCREAWYKNGLFNLTHKAEGKPVIKKRKDGGVDVSFVVHSQGAHAGRAIYKSQREGSPAVGIEEGRELTENDFHFLTSILYTVYPDGTIIMGSSIVSSNPSLALPRIGYGLKLPKSLDHYTYYGRGPWNNYNDRKTGSFIGLYESSVADQFVNFPKPQSMGNREDVRWCALTDSDGDGLQFVCLKDVMSTSALPWSQVQLLKAAHPHELTESDGTYLHLDAKVNGLGGNSCGQGGPLTQDRVLGELHQMQFAICPLLASPKVTARPELPEVPGGP